MFGLLNNKLLWGVLGGALLVVVLVGVGYRAGATSVRADWDAERAATLAETSDALALLAARYAASEAKYAAERDRKARVIERRIEVVRREIQRIPERGCPVDSRARRLLVNAICAPPRNAARAECVPSQVPGTPDATGSGATGIELQSVDLRAYPVG